MAHVYIAVAVARKDRKDKDCYNDAFNLLCEYIPAYFDYVDEDDVCQYTVEEVRNNKEILTNVYAYFTEYESYSKDLNDWNIENGLLWNLRADDLIYIFHCHE